MGGDPIRPGARGGHDQFSWEQVKEDRKFRGNYLGNSIRARVTRHGHKDDPFWYTKDGSENPKRTDEDEDDELARIRQQEAKLMGQVLAHGFSIFSKDKTQLASGEALLAMNLQKGEEKSANISKQDKRYLDKDQSNPNFPHRTGDDQKRISSSGQSNNNDNLQSYRRSKDRDYKTAERNHSNRDRSPDQHRFRDAYGRNSKHS